MFPFTEIFNTAADSFIFIGDDTCDIGVSGEVTEYNNDLAIRLAEYAQEATKRAQQIEKNEIDLASKRTNYVAKSDSVAQQKIFDAVSRYLADLPPAKAIAELEKNSYYRGVLSELNFNLLYNAYVTRFDWGE